MNSDMGMGGGMGAQSKPVASPVQPMTQAGSMLNPQNANALLQNGAISPQTHQAIMQSPGLSSQVNNVMRPVVAPRPQPVMSAQPMPNQSMLGQNGQMGMRPNPNYQPSTQPQQPVPPAQPAPVQPNTWAPGQVATEGWMNPTTPQQTQETAAYKAQNQAQSMANGWDPNGAHTIVSMGTPAYGLRPQTSNMPSTMQQPMNQTMQQPQISTQQPMNNTPQVYQPSQQGTIAQPIQQPQQQHFIAQPISQQVGTQQPQPSLWTPAQTNGFQNGGQNNQPQNYQAMIQQMMMGNSNNMMF